VADEWIVIINQVAVTHTHKDAGSRRALECPAATYFGDAMVIAQSRGIRKVGKARGSTTWKPALNVFTTWSQAAFATR
jgi:hypothetical protein